MGGRLRKRKTSVRIRQKKRDCRAGDKAVARDKYLQRTYNITLEEYDKLIAVYGGVCWVCRMPPKPGVNLAVDHDHKLAKETKNIRWSVRGTLCWYCNKKVIGRRRRANSEILLRAYEYLNDNSAQKVLNEDIVTGH